MTSINEFQGEYRFLSNFWKCPVNYAGMNFNNSEAAFAAMKSNSIIERMKFVNLSAAEAKKAGRSIELRPDWKEVKVKIMSEVIHAKFTQNPDLRRKLIDTGHMSLIEGNAWKDSFWGVYQGSGTNWLGRILMAERAYWVVLYSYLAKAPGSPNNEYRR